MLRRANKHFPSFSVYYSADSKEVGKKIGEEEAIKSGDFKTTTFNYLLFENTQKKFLLLLFWETKKQVFIHNLVKTK